VNTQDVLGNLLGGALMGLFALALDYFFLQYVMGSPIARSGGVTIWVVLIYIIVPFLIVQFASGKKQ
jgi:hypothetical protein